MIRFLFLILTITTATLAAPHPQAATDGVDDEIFDDDDYDGVEVNYEGEVEDTVECDIFEDEECDTTTEEECKPKATEQFLIDLRSNERTSNDCNKTAKCTHYQGEGFSCVPYWQCKDTDSKVISDGFGVIDLRKDEEEDCVNKVGTIDASDDKCPDKEGHVCCKNANIGAEICPPGRKEEPRTTVTVTPTDIVTVTSPVTFERQTSEKPPESHSDCGRTGSKTKVTNLDDKNAAQPGEFPHMCIVYKLVNDQRVYLGGASLIDKNKVISVAHKFYVQHGEQNTIDERDNVENLLVRCGEYNVKTEAELLDYQETSVVAIHVHPLYKPNLPYLPNNLVILQTKQNFIYQDHIGPVCLPEPGDDFENASCWSSGWGKDAFGAIGYYSDVLKKVEMPIIDNNKCQSDLREAIMNKTGSSTTNFRLDESHLCVGGVPAKDTCTGDGGSPHSCKINGKWTQVGTVAWGIGCGSEIPAIYSSIPDAMCWINHLLSCVLIATKDINGQKDVADAVDLRTIGDCEDEKFLSILSSCEIYENQQSFDRGV